MPDAKAPEDNEHAYESCLVAKLGHYIDIANDEYRLLARLEKSERAIEAGEEIFAGGDPIDNLFVVKHGWLYTYSDLPDGKRLLVRVYHAGDIIGLPTLAFDHRTVNLRAATQGCLCPFPKSELNRVLTEAPRIAALLLTFAGREEALLVDRLRAMARMPPDQRIGHFLLSLHARLKITNRQMTDRFSMPLNQSEIGDAVGLTNVTVSRTLTAMEEAKWIERERGMIAIVDVDDLISRCDFHDRHAHMDTSWFPG